MKAARDPASVLAALLDALEAELLGATREEVRASLQESGRAREAAVQEVRSLLRDAVMGEADGCAPASVPGGPAGMGTQRH